MLQKNANPKSTTGKANPLPVVLSLTVSARMVRSFPVRKVAIPPHTTPLASVAGSVRMRSTDSDRSVRATPKKARDASPPPQDDLRPTHQQLVERQPEFRKAGAAAWLALKRDNQSLHTVHRKWSSPRVSDHLCKRFSLRKPGDLRKAMQGARIRTSASGRDYRQVLQSLVPRRAADKDKLAAFFCCKDCTTIQRSPDVKARNFLDHCSHLLVARPSRQPLLRRPRFGFKHPF
ncbi:hypothetical protein BASA83_011606 [Batrachochytrium salamandrivorans]|nr:hypothetical protein BASA83_011606 [Batrachochytrium salamandrivorans]